MGTLPRLFHFFCCFIPFVLRYSRFFVTFELAMSLPGFSHLGDLLRTLMKKELRRLEFPQTTVYIGENIQSVPHDEVMRLLETLPAWRKEKALAIKNDSVRRESVLSFALLMHALKKEMGVTGGLEVTYTEHGKPLLKHHPGVHFNLSHCREAVACAVGECQVGVDVERRGRYDEVLARHISNDNELDGILEDADSDLAFTTLWTKKEALLKMTGAGVGGNMKNVLDGETLCDISTVVADSYVCSVAVDKKAR